MRRREEWKRVWKGLTDDCKHLPAARRLYVACLEILVFHYIIGTWIVMENPGFVVADRGSYSAPCNFLVVLGVSSVAASRPPRLSFCICMLVFAMEVQM